MFWESEKALRPHSFYQAKPNKPWKSAKAQCSLFSVLGLLALRCFRFFFPRLFRTCKLSKSYIEFLDIRNGPTSSLSPFMLRPLCVPRLLSLSTVILPSNRSDLRTQQEDARERQKQGFSRPYRIRSRVKVTSQVAFSGLAAHSLPFLPLTSGPFAPG